MATKSAKMIPLWEFLAALDPAVSHPQMDPIQPVPSHAPTRPYPSNERLEPIAMQAQRSLPRDPKAEFLATRWAPTMADQLEALRNDPSGLMMGSVVPMGELAGAVRQGIKAYHGSPHDFDQFSLGKIGTGEGAQAYGHGLYFAEHPETAKAYRDALAKDMFYSQSGEMFDPQSQLQHMNVRVAARNNGPDIDATIARAKELLPKASEQTRPMLEHDLSVLQKFKDSGGISKNPGRMYEVNINADPNDFLDWDAPLSQQSEKVQKLANERWRMNNEVRPDAPGSVLHRKLGAIGPNSMTARMPPGEQTAEGVLKAQGIPGIKYLDGGSRSAGQGTRNYVVFDDKIISIVKKYGIAGAVAAGLLTQLQARQLAEQVHQQ